MYVFKAGPMKAYGMGVLIRNSLGVRTEVFSEDYGKTDNIRVISHLDCAQFEQLQKLAEVNGWRFFYRSWREGDRYLALTPSGER